MGNALELVAGFNTAPGATVTALAAATGQTFTIRNCPPNVDIRLLSMWAFNATAGVFRIRSPRLHDNVQGIRLQVIAATPAPMFPPMPVQKLYAQDQLIPELSGGGGAEIDTGFFIVYYQDLPGVAARFIDNTALMARGVNLVGVEVDTTPGAGGGWTGASALNKTFDNLKANTDYALLGCTLSASCGGIGITGPDTGNLRLGVPGMFNHPILMQDWFTWLTRLAGIPLIPVINSANKSGTSIDVAQNNGGAAVNVSLTFVELAPGGAASPTARAAGA